MLVISPTEDENKQLNEINAEIEPLQIPLTGL